MPEDTTTTTTERLRSAADAARAEAQSTIERLRAQADQVAERMRPKLDAVTTYVKDEPTKAMLASAAVGAGVMALIVLLSRSGRSTRPVAGVSAMATIRDAALALADRAHGAATDALHASQSRAQGLFARAGRQTDHAFAAAEQGANSLHGNARARAEQAAARGQDLAEQAAARAEKLAAQGVDGARAKAGEFGAEAETALHDAWDAIREQADPLIERYRPQIESAVRYAKDEPTRTALGAAAAGAVLIGLLALARSRD